MRKALFLLVFGFWATFTSFAQTVNITFQVENPDSTDVFVQGSWDWGNFPGLRLNPIGNGLYSGTVQLDASRNYEYLYWNGTPPVKEVLTAGSPCTVNQPPFVNRTFVTGTTDQTVCSVWSSCNTCQGLQPSIVDVTFQVENPDSTDVFVQGSWDWSNFPGLRLNPIGNGLYSGTIQLDASRNYEYLYWNGTPPVKEVLTAGSPCTVNQPPFVNRTFSTGTSNQTICNVWSSCNICQGSQPTTVTVTFQVQNPDSTDVFVQGSWDWGNFPGLRLNPIGNGLYSGEVTLSSSRNYEYLYWNGTPPVKETLMQGMPCTVNAPPFVNRTIVTGTANQTRCNVWATCNACTTIAIDEVHSNMKLVMGKNGLTLLSEEFTQLDGLEVYDVLGRNIYSSSDKINMNTLVSMNLESSTLYLVRVRSGNKTSTFKGIIIE